MNEQLDFVGGGPSAKPFKDIRNTRPSTADEKAVLALDLGRLCLKPPPGVVNGGIQRTRDWVKSQKEAMKLLKNSRASVGELSAACNRMRSFR